MSATLHNGSQGFDVAVLQVQLNLQGAIPRLNIDGIYGPLTQEAVFKFQKKRGLVTDGVAGTQTRTAAADGLTLTTINHNLRRIPQPTPTTCWAASTAVMTHSTVEAVKAKTPADMILPDGSLRNYSGTDQALESGNRYAQIHGLHCYPPMSWAVPAFVELIRRSPLMLDMLWNSSDYAEGHSSPGHMVVVNAVISDNDPAGEGTYLQILDPLPPHVGKVSYEEYAFWINLVPTRTYRTFTR